MVSYRALFPLLVLASSISDVVTKDGWICENDGFYHQNGVKSAYPCKKDDSQTDKSEKDDSDETKDIKDGWTCESDGFYYQNGVKSKYTCKKDESKDSQSKKDDSNETKRKLQSCTRSTDPNMPSTYPKTCIRVPPDNGLRCWWTHTPNINFKTNPKLPLIIDMHGGGGCASHQMISSGWRELADTLGTRSKHVMNTFITVWPQGHLNQWGSCGSEWKKCEEDAGSSKSIHKTDDIRFLSDMIAHMVKGKGHVDAQRVYTTGFSMGCMMAHRLALERSDIVAGVGCHGGTLIQIDSDLSAQKARFQIQPMPVFMTGGSEDAWFTMAKTAFLAWATWNNCGANTTTEVAPANISPTTGKLTVAKCGNSSPIIEVVRFELTNDGHRPDSRMAAYTWDFLKKYSRVGALGKLPADPGAATSFGMVLVSPATLIIVTTLLVVSSVVC